MITAKGFTRSIPLLALAAVLSVEGCIPVPRTITISPPIVGHLERPNGTPIAGARVVVSNEIEDPTCARPAASTITDAQGRFELPATTYRQPYIPVLGHLVYTFRVCIGDADILHPVYQTSRVQGSNPDPPTLVLSCVKTTMAERQDSTRVIC